MTSSCLNLTIITKLESVFGKFSLKHLKVEDNPSDMISLSDYCCYHTDKIKVNERKYLTCFDPSLLFQLLIKTIGVVCHLTLNGKRFGHRDDACTHSGCSSTESASMFIDSTY